MGLGLRGPCRRNCPSASADLESGLGCVGWRPPPRPEGMLGSLLGLGGARVR